MNKRSDSKSAGVDQTAMIKLSGRDTAIALAASDEDWSEWDVVTADGLEGIVWKTTFGRAPAVRNTKYSAKETTSKSAKTVAVKKGKERSSERSRR